MQQLNAGNKLVLKSFCFCMLGMSFPHNVKPVQTI